MCQICNILHRYDTEWAYLCLNNYIIHPCAEIRGSLTINAERLLMTAVLKCREQGKKRADWETNLKHRNLCHYKSAGMYVSL